METVIGDAYINALKSNFSVQFPSGNLIRGLVPFVNFSDAYYNRSRPGFSASLAG